ncbi:protein MTSS 1 [Frankliniella occidentalis]|uniref:Protein MTSS 1 n=1 Tax=Frankliniella occidentalis TaxID=133901 RepID=A0A9C6TWL4_FRAOC|nr:protein MTSS 1 [Frankliniella occidentalis]
MEVSLERECSALGGLFHQIILDMKNGTPLWEDFVAKATKLHTCLRATLQAIAAYLDAFQKIADAATNARGATKEIGTALTRICLRHKAVEARMKTFSTAIMDCLVIPLQEKLEDWKKTVINLDKDHAKEYKRAKSELKKRSTDTLRLQKKARKGCGGDLAKRVESCLADVTERRHLLEHAEKQAVRAALIEERARFCTFATFLKPVVNEEVAMLSEMGHLQEVVDVLDKHTSDPLTLPPASEQVIADLKGSESSWTFQTPPSSPSSLGSRKSSMCSISSLNSSSSGSTKSHHSPSHHYWHRSLSQRPLPSGRSSTLRSSVLGGTLHLSSVSSQDSGFTSQDGLQLARSNQASNMSEHSGGSSNGSTPTTPHALLPNQNNTATWPNLQETLQFERAASAILNERPHTISSAYERGHQRPPLTVYTFHAPENNLSHSQPVSPVSGSVSGSGSASGSAESSGATAGSPATPVAHSSPQPIYATRNECGIAQPIYATRSECGTASPQPIYASRSEIVNSQPIYGSRSDCSSGSPQPIYAALNDPNGISPLPSPKPQPIYARPPVIPQRHSSLERPSVPAKTSGSAGCVPNALSSNPHTQHLRAENQIPTYVNMHELASMAASKAQEMTYLPPPPPEMVSNDTPDKVDGPERDGSTSESSLESSSGYGSQTAIAMTDDGNHLEGYAMGRGGTLLRRGSNQGPKPPPPTRRTSSISTAGLTSQGAPPPAAPAPAPPAQPPQHIAKAGSMENLPPPPAYLLDPENHDDHHNLDDGLLPHGTVRKVASELKEKLGNNPANSTAFNSVIAQNAKLMASIKKQSSNPNMKNVKLSAAGVVGQPQQQRTSSLGRMTAVEALRAGAGGCFTGPELMRTSASGISIPVAQPNKTAESDGLPSVADAVRTLTELKHQPASPVSVRRTHSLRSQSAERKAGEGQPAAGGGGGGVGGVGSNFIAALSAKLGPTLSPRHSRRHSEDLQPLGGATGSPRMGQSFRESLTARLSHQQQAQHQQQQQQKASRVRQWINMRTAPDPATCHDSLMDQIKRGKPLKKTGGVNDRSAPRIL